MGNLRNCGQTGSIVEGFKTAMFLLVIGEDGLGIFHGMDFSQETDREILNNDGKSSMNFALEKQTKRIKDLSLIDKIWRRMSVDQFTMCFKD